MENEVMKTQNATPTRDIQTITAEIKDICRQAHSMALLYAIEIGRRLEEAKLMLPHGQWGEWLKTEVEFSQSTANNYMRLFDEYGAAQISIFGASVNSQSIANLPYTKALQLLAVPREEREAFAEKVGAEDLSVSELKEAIKERDEAIKEREEAKAHEEAMSQRVASVEIARNAAEQRAKKADVLQKQVDEMTAEMEKSKQKAAELKKKLKEAEENPTIPKATLEKIRKEAADAAKKEAEAASGEALEQARKALQEAKEEAVAARLEEKRAKEQLQAAEKKLKTAGPEVTAFKALFDQMQGTADKLRLMIGSIRENDPETADKLSAAMKAFGASL